MKEKPWFVTCLSRMLLLLLQLVVGLPCAFAPPRFNAESFADHSHLNSTDDHQHAHNGTDGLQHLLNNTESLHHHNESLVLHHNETERTHPQNGTESPVRQRGNGTDANPGHRQPGRLTSTVAFLIISDIAGSSQIREVDSVHDPYWASCGLIKIFTYLFLFLRIRIRQFGSDLIQICNTDWN